MGVGGHFEMLAAEATRTCSEPFSHAESQRAQEPEVPGAGHEGRWTWREMKLRG